MTGQMRRESVRLDEDLTMQAGARAKVAQMLDKYEKQEKSGHKRVYFGGSLQRVKVALDESLGNSIKDYVSQFDSGKTRLEKLCYH